MPHVTLDQFDTLVERLYWLIILGADNFLREYDQQRGMSPGDETTDE